MRIAVFGATGNLGTSALAALAAAPEVEQITGVARRRPELELPKVSWRQADIACDALDFVAGHDAVVCLAWLIQPSRDEPLLERTNLHGSRRVFQATVAAGVPKLIYASSVGAYSEGPKDRLVDESWPTAGIVSSYYSRQKAAVERMLDEFEGQDTAIVRLRPGLVFKREAASEIRRLFAGPLLPSALIRPDLIPVVPETPRLSFQAVHSLDVGEAISLAALSSDAAGAYNLAADPVLDPTKLAQLLGARRMPVRAGVLRGAASATWRLRLQPASPGWLDMALGVPLMDSRRAHDELGWRPRRGAGEALLELLDGIRNRGDLATPPLAAGTGGPWRLREILAGTGSREIR